jgi:hypothetical protein
MIGSTPLAKAELRQLDAEGRNPIERDTWVTVQFNPETLKVSFANQLRTPDGAGDQSGTAARQFVGAGTTRLALQLLFDVTQPQPDGAPVDDVRRLTQKVAYFITPKAQGRDLVPPQLRFVWGSFQFDGLMDSLEETLEFWSPEGRPLRATLNLAMSQQRITAFAFGQAAGAAGAGGAAAGAGLPGTRPLAEAGFGGSVQALADAAGQGADWARIAAANGIENPRLLAPGQLIDLSARAPRPF